MREKQNGERFEDAPLTALKMEKRPHAKELRQPPGGGKGEEREAHLLSPEGRQPCQDLDVSPGIPSLDFQHVEL